MLNNIDESLLEHLICPIGLEIMKEPVIAEDGITYEKSAIELWFTKNKTSPTNGILLQNTNVRPNITIKNIIELYNQIKSKKINNNNNNNNKLPIHINNNILGNNNQLNFFMCENNKEKLEISDNKNNINNCIDNIEKLVPKNENILYSLNNNLYPYNKDETNNENILANNDKEIFDNYIFDENFNCYKKFRLQGKILQAFNHLEKSYKGKFIFAEFHMYFHLKGIIGDNEIIQKNEAREKEAFESFSINFEYLELLVSEGNSDAANILSICYHEGIHFNKNKSKAIELLQKPVNQNCAFCLNFLGFLLQDEQPLESVEAWKLSSKLGNLSAKYNLILAYHTGNQNVLDEEIRKLADREDYYLASHDTGLYFEKKIKFNEEKISEEIFDFDKELNADANNISNNNNNNIAVINNKQGLNNNNLSESKENNINASYLKNTFLNNNSNFIKAVFYYTKAAEQGFIASMAKLGKLHLASIINSGFRDFKSGIFYLNKAKKKLDLTDYLNILTKNKDLKDLFLPFKDSKNKDTNNAKDNSSVNNNKYSNNNNLDNFLFLMKNQKNNIFDNDISKNNNLNAEKESQDSKKFEKLFEFLIDNNLIAANENENQNKKTFLADKNLNIGARFDCDNNHLLEEFEVFINTNCERNEKIKNVFLNRKRNLKK